MGGRDFCKYEALFGEKAEDSLSSRYYHVVLRQTVCLSSALVYSEGP